MSFLPGVCRRPSVRFGGVSTQALRPRCTSVGGFGWAVCAVLCLLDTSPLRGVSQARSSPAQQASSQAPGQEPEKQTSPTAAPAHERSEVSDDARPETARLRFVRGPWR